MPGGRLLLMLAPRIQTTRTGISSNRATYGAEKSELYSSLWQSCDELRGGMDASQYKDYVLVLLFIKYSTVVICHF